MFWKRIVTTLLCTTVLAAFGCNDDEDVDIDEINNDETVNNNDFINNDYLNNDIDEPYDSENQPSSPRNTITLDQFEQQITRGMTEYFCRSAFECPELQAIPMIVSIAGRFGDLETCIDNYNPGINSRLMDTERALIENGTLEYDASQATACLNEMLGGLTACVDIDTDFSTDPASDCTGVFVAQLADGDACVHDLECTSERCVAEDDVCGGVCGTPIETALENTNCAGAPCEEGLICVFEGRDDLNDFVCAQPRTLERGELCYGYSERCVEGLICGAGGTCADPPTYVGSGETCNQLNRLCEPGLACHGVGRDDVGSNGTCGALHTLGESCQLSEHCLFGLYCASSTTDDATCQAQKQLADTCIGVDGDECTTGLFCSQESGAPVCDTLIVADGGCNSGAE